MKQQTENNELLAFDQAQKLFDGETVTGFEGTTPETFKTPFVRVLQAQSPEIKKTDPKYIPGAEQGMLFNTATSQLYSHIKIHVVKIEHSLILWKPERGGFSGRMHKGEGVVVRQEGNKKWDASGNEVMDAIEFFCINADDHSDVFILSFSAASYKHGRSFATRLRMLKSNGVSIPFSWAGIWQISTMEEKNDKGSWYTIGTTPSFVRFITIQEKDDTISPVREMLDTAETDYKSIESVSTTTEEY